MSFIAVAVIYSFADISGAHFNPAVTFATVVTGKMTWKKGASFMAAQLLGSVWASFWVRPAASACPVPCRFASLPLPLCAHLIGRMRCDVWCGGGLVHCDVP